MEFRVSFTNIDQHCNIRKLIITHFHQIVKLAIFIHFYWPLQFFLVYDTYCTEMYTHLYCDVLSFSVKINCQNCPKFREIVTFSFLTVVLTGATVVDMCVRSVKHEIVLSRDRFRFIEGQQVQRTPPVSIASSSWHWHWRSNPIYICVLCSSYTTDIIIIIRYCLSIEVVVDSAGIWPPK